MFVARFQQHILWHHPYTNHHGLDGDAASAEPALLFHDYGTDSTVKKAHHAFQHVYMHLVLALYGPSIVLNPGYLTEMRHGPLTPDVLVKENGYLRDQRSLAWCFRVFYIIRAILVPWWFCGVPLLFAAVYVSGVCGAILTFLFVVSHNFVGSDRHPCRAEPEEGKKEPKHTDWYKAQVETSCTYGGNVAMFFTGGLNLQIEHHLFPRLSSWHYPKIQPIVQKCCEDHGVKYVYYPTLLDNLRSTWKYMQSVGIMETLKHATKEF